MTAPRIEPAILSTLRTAPGLRMHELLARMRRRGFNGHAVRTAVTALVKQGALRCDDRAYFLAQRRTYNAERVFALLRAARAPLTACELIAALEGELPAPAVRNALMTLYNAGRIDREGEPHRFRYFACAIQPPARRETARAGEPPAAVARAPALAPIWPAPADATPAPLAWRLVA